ncbi:hypothetical protein K466DRAFT_8122 [Polyporus arcularius HHB13444]|uniref:Uncharacterized protein n=1 Tax=Polyporus arcularius HHB13444 TaxID=1314778 RepID=A0A5C3NQX2_9APHY|nr:hypothetical protein K466DRAFT_8122 [Polyporus arcularius HHB13444]
MVRMVVGVTSGVWVMISVTVDAGLLIAGVATGSEAEGVLPVGALAGTATESAGTLTGSEAEGALTGSEGEGALTGIEDRIAPTGSEGVSIGSARALGAFVGALTGSEGAPTAGGPTGRDGAAAEGTATEGALGDGTAMEGVPTAGWLSDRAAMEGAATEGVLIAGRLTGSEGSPLIGSASTGALAGAPTAGMLIGGMIAGSPEGMGTGRLVARALIDTPRAIDGTLNDGTRGRAMGRLGAATGILIAGPPMDGLANFGAPTSGLTEGTPTPLTGSEGKTGRLESPGRNSSTNSEDDNSRESGELRGEHVHIETDFDPTEFSEAHKEVATRSSRLNGACKYSVVLIRTNSRLGWAR